MRTDWDGKAEALQLEWGARVRGLREERGWSQRDLAAMLEVTQAAVKHWESGAHEPRLSAKLQLADLFGMEASELFPVGARRRRARAPKVDLGKAALLTRDMADIMRTAKLTRASLDEVADALDGLADELEAGA